MAIPTGVAFMLDRQRLVNGCSEICRSLDRAASIRYKSKRHGKSIAEVLSSIDRRHSYNLRKLFKILSKHEKELQRRTWNICNQSLKMNGPKMFLWKPAKVSPELTCMINDLQSYSRLLKDVSSELHLSNWTPGSRDEPDENSILDEYEEEQVEAEGEEEEEEETQAEATKRLLRQARDCVRRVNGYCPKRCSASRLDNDNEEEMENSETEQSATSTTAPFDKEETLEILRKHANRHTYSGCPSYVNNEVAEMVSDILTKKSEIVAVAQLLEKFSAALDRPVPILSAVPDRLFPSRRPTKMSSPIPGLNSSYKMPDEWCAHGGSLLTRESMNMEKMIERQKQIRRCKERRDERKRRGMIKFVSIDGDGIGYDHVVMNGVQDINCVVSKRHDCEGEEIGGQEPGLPERKRRCAVDWGEVKRWARVPKD